MPTEKLYYADSHLAEFTATVLSCVPDGRGAFAVVLDQTAFFPEGGGQRADTGVIAGVHVTDVHERGGEIVHTCDAPLEPGGEVPCRIDAEQRLRRMQSHSGEHVVSGLVHNMFGYENVGFHMAEDNLMTIDFSGELTWAQLQAVEKKANEAVRANLKIKTSFPPEEELAALQYRSKLDLKENVRIVEIEGIDRCACCAPHVSLTGEIGIIKVFSAERHRGGTRVELACGMSALEMLSRRCAAVDEISAMLSAKRNEVAAATGKLLEERDALKMRIGALERELTVLRAEKYAETPASHCVFFAPGEASDIAMRELVNLLMPKAGRFAACFMGDDGQGYRYVIGSLHEDMRAATPLINKAIDGRGGGRDGMITGSCKAGKDAILAFFS